MSLNERDLRLTILNSLLTTPHRQLGLLWPIHQELIRQDPRFYVQLAAWYYDHGDVRDHKEMFVINLVLSEHAGHRDVGLAMLRSMPPYQVVRVVDFIKGRVDEVADSPSENTRKARRSKPPAEVSDKSVARSAKPTVRVGLFRNPPRSLVTEVTRYLHERENDADWFDSSVLVARKAIKRLYAVLHIKPGVRAQRVLFDDDPPEDSKLFALKGLARATSPAEQAAAIIANRIPFRVAATVVPKMSPEVTRALVEVMSAQELINNLAALQRRGAFDDAQTKAMIDDKLNSAKTADRVSALKADVAKRVGVDDETRQKLEAVADAQLKARGRVTRPTALLIDKSASMDVAIELGKQIGAMVSSVCEGGLFTYAFDSLAYPITPAGQSLADWEKALAGIKAGGNTSCGIALETMRRKKQRVEQVILITDEEENSAPFFVKTLQFYCQELATDVNVCIVRTPNGRDQLEKECMANGIVANVFHFTGDYYSLPNLIPMLARPSRLDLLMEIIEYPLPQRKPA